MENGHNTKVSSLAHGPWRYPPGQDRKAGEVTVRQMTPEELEKYRDVGKPMRAPAMIGVEYQARREKKDVMETKITKARVLELAAEGKNIEQIMEYFKENYQGNFCGAIKAKIKLYANVPKEKTEDAAEKPDKGTTVKTARKAGPVRASLKPRVLVSQNIKGNEYELMADEVGIKRTNEAGESTYQYYD
jgi:hypothetical protein